MGAFNPTIHAPVTPGLTYTTSIGYRLVSGTAPSGALFVRGEQFTNAGNIVAGIGVSLGLLTSTLQRGAVIEVAAATAAYIRPNIFMSVNNGEVVDVTIRFYTANVELGTGNARPLLQRNVPEVVADVGGVDAEALLAHCRFGQRLRDATWYDQSGNGRNATQTTAAKQPRIVNSGAIETQNGRPALFFDGSTFFDHPIFISGPSTFVAVAIRSGADSEAQSIFFATPPNTQLDNGMWSKVTTSTNWGTYSDNFNSANADLTGALAVISTTSNSPPTGVIDMRTNGELLASSGAARYPGDVHDRRRIGSEHPASTRFHIGWISEIIPFPSVLSTTDRQTLERNQGAEFGITVA
jgi:hypothetical protein